MDYASEEFGIPVHVLEGMSQNFSATSAHDLLWETEKSSNLYTSHINSLGEMVFLNTYIYIL